MTQKIIPEKWMDQKEPLRREKMIQELLEDPDLVELVPSIARKDKKDEVEVWKRAKTILYELTSNYSPRAVSFSYVAFRWLWRILYDEIHVDQAGIERLKEMVREYPTLLIPSHKTHMDYMVLSAILYENGMAPPHIAAGINLSFWPVGPLFRKNGAYFIRRKITADLLYARILYLYIRWLIQNKEYQEFFIEGGRTRTGKMVRPKHGLLSMQVDSFLGSSVKDLFAIPISISYEKVPEETSYLHELVGGVKKKENFLEVIRSWRILKRKHGSAYVRFGKPISLTTYLGTNNPDQISTKDKKGKIQDLAGDIAREITWETTISFTSLAALSLLSQPEKEMEISIFKSQIELFRNFAQTKGFPLSEKLEKKELDLDWILSFLTRHEWILKAPSMTKILINNKKRITLDFYKNSVLHYFISAAIPLLVQEIKGENRDVSEKTLCSIFQHEFFLPVDFTLEKPESAFNGILSNYVEAYVLAAQEALDRHLTRNPLQSSEVQEIMEVGKKNIIQGVFKFPEAITTANIKSAFQYFHENGILNDEEKLKAFLFQIQQIKLQ